MRSRLGVPDNTALRVGQTARRPAPRRAHDAGDSPNALASTVPEHSLTVLSPRTRASLAMLIALFHVGVAKLALDAVPVRAPIDVPTPLSIDVVAPSGPQPLRPPPMPREPVRTPTAVAPVARAPVRPVSQAPQPVVVETPAPPAFAVPPPDSRPAPPAPAVHAAPVSHAAPEGAPVAAPAAQAAPPGPKSLSISAVEYLTPPVLQYPPTSRRLQEEGRVNVRVLVDVDGRPRETQVIRSSGYPRLDSAALVTVVATRFKPHTENGVPRAFWVVMPLQFELEN